MGTVLYDGRDVFKLTEAVKTTEDNARIGALIGALGLITLVAAI